jgi:hypothetical protein
MIFYIVTESNFGSSFQKRKKRKQEEGKKSASAVIFPRRESIHIFARQPVHRRQAKRISIIAHT